MPTINAGRVGYIRGTGSSNYTTAKTSNGSVAYDSQTGNVSNAIMAFFSLQEEEVVPTYFTVLIYILTLVALLQYPQVQH